MKAVKGNKEYSIDESQKKLYQDRGFDIKDNKGEVIAYGRGKTVPYDEYEKIMKQNEALKEQVDELQAELDVSTAKIKPSKAKKEDDNSNESSNKTPDNQEG